MPRNEQPKLSEINRSNGCLIAVLAYDQIRALPERWTTSELSLVRIPLFTSIFRILVPDTEKSFPMNAPLLQIFALNYSELCIIAFFDLFYEDWHWIMDWKR